MRTYIRPLPALLCSMLVFALSGCGGGKLSSLLDEANTPQRNSSNFGANSDWSLLGGNMSGWHTAAATLPAPYTQDRIPMRRSVVCPDGSISGTPVIGNGPYGQQQLYVVSTPNQTFDPPACDLLCYSAKTLDLLWLYPGQSGLNMQTTPAVGRDGTVYFWNRGRLDAVSNTGSLKWSYATGASQASQATSPVLFPKDENTDWILLALEEGHFYALQDMGDHAEVKRSFAIYNDPEDPGDNGFFYYGMPAVSAVPYEDPETPPNASNPSDGHLIVYIAKYCSGQPPNPPGMKLTAYDLLRFDYQTSDENYYKIEERSLTGYGTFETFDPHHPVIDDKGRVYFMTGDMFYGFRCDLEDIDGASQWPQSSLGLHWDIAPTCLPDTDGSQWTDSTVLVGLLSYPVGSIAISRLVAFDGLGNSTFTSEWLDGIAPGAPGSDSAGNLFVSLGGGGGSDPLGPTIVHTFRRGGTSSWTHESSGGPNSPLPLFFSFTGSPIICEIPSFGTAIYSSANDGRVYSLRLNNQTLPTAQQLDWQGWDLRTSNCRVSWYPGPHPDAGQPGDVGMIISDGVAGRLRSVPATTHRLSLAEHLPDRIWAVNSLGGICRFDLDDPPVPGGLPPALQLGWQYNYGSGGGFWGAPSLVMGPQYDMTAYFVTGGLTVGVQENTSPPVPQHLYGNPPPGPTCCASPVAFRGPDNVNLLVSSSDSGFRVWNTETNTFVGGVSAPAGYICVSPVTIAQANGDGPFVLLHLYKQEPIQWPTANFMVVGYVLKPHMGGYNIYKGYESVAFNSDYMPPGPPQEFSIAWRRLPGSVGGGGGVPPIPGPGGGTGGGSGEITDQIFVFTPSQLLHYELPPVPTQAPPGPNITANWTVSSPYYRLAGPGCVSPSGKVYFPVNEGDHGRLVGVDALQNGAVVWSSNNVPDGFNNGISAPTLDSNDWLYCANREHFMVYNPADASGSGPRFDHDVNPQGTASLMFTGPPSLGRQGVYLPLYDYGVVPEQSHIYGFYQN